MMRKNETTKEGYVDMKFSPLWDYIPFIREYIHNVLTLYIEESKGIEKVTLTVSEMLENAVKYSQKEGIRMTLEMNTEKPIELKIYNFAHPEHVRNLFHVVEELKAVEPLNYYVQKMRESVDRQNGEANIGLARIYYEGEATISAQYVKDDLLEVQALFKSLSGGNYA